MAQMTPRTRRPRRTTTRLTSASTGPAAVLLGSLNDVLAENASLVKENNRLRALIARIGSLTAGAGPSDNAPADGRRRRRTSTSTEAEPAPIRRRRGRPAASSTAETPKRTRRKITDPTVLAKRREALARARAVRAERRAQTAADA